MIMGVNLSSTHLVLSSFVVEDGDFSVRVEVGDSMTWYPNAHLATFMSEMHDCKRGCLFIDLDSGPQLFVRVLQRSGLFSCLSVVSENFSFSGPVVWSTEYLVSVVLSPEVRVLVDLDHFGDRAAEPQAHTLGFCSPGFGFKRTGISILRVVSRLPSAVDLLVFSLVVRGGEKRVLSRDLEIVSHDKVFEYAREVLRAYVARG